MSLESSDSDLSFDGQNGSIEIGAKAKVHEPIFDPKFAFKFLISSDDPKSSIISPLRHPKLGANSSLFQLSSSGSLNEVFRIDAGPRSWFCGTNTLVADGTFKLCTPIHPLFLILPYLIENAKNRFVLLDQILDDPIYPILNRLINNEKLLKSIGFCTDTKDVSIGTVYRYNSEKTLSWLNGRFERLKSALENHGHLHQAVISDDQELRRYTFSILCDYLPLEICTLLKQFLDIKDTEKMQKFKRKISESDIIESQYQSCKKKPNKKLPELSSSQKKLQKASKGTKSLMGFFK